MDYCLVERRIVLAGLGVIGGLGVREAYLVKQGLFNRRLHGFVQILF
jgi:hypothetical protein